MHHFQFIARSLNLQLLAAKSAKKFWVLNGDFPHEKSSGKTVNKM